MSFCHFVFISPTRHIVRLEAQVEGYEGHVPLTEAEVKGRPWDLPLVTESTVHLALQPEDNGHQLVCRAENGLLRRSALEGSLRLNVACKWPETLQREGSL